MHCRFENASVVYCYFHNTHRYPIGAEPAKDQELTVNGGVSSCVEPVPLMVWILELQLQDLGHCPGFLYLKVQPEHKILSISS